MPTTKGAAYVRSARRDYLAIIEAAYACPPSNQDWVNGIAEAAAPVLDQGMGVIAYAFDAHASPTHRLRALGQAGGPASFAAGARDLIAALSPEVALLLFQASPPVERLQRVFAQAAPSAQVLQILRHHEASDAIGVRGSNPHGRGVILAAATRSGANLPARQTWCLSRLALHLAAAARLRDAMGKQSQLESADAIFSPQGRLEHVASPEVGQRETSLLSAAVERRLAANRAKNDPKQALELWRGLVAGRWSVVDHVDRDGKRFVLVKSNPLGVADPAALSPRERLVFVYAAWGHSNKLIEYETGLSPAAVSTHLRQALRKLRVKSRAELALLFGKAAPSRR